MTRIVSAFFAAVAFLMVVYWVVPGAEPPGLVAAVPAKITVPIGSPPATVAATKPLTEPVPAAAAVASLAPPPAPTPVRAVARVAAGGCDGDAIRCMLEGRNAADLADVTGSIVATPRKASAQSHGKPLAKITR